MKLFLFTVSMIVAVTVNCHGPPEPPYPKPPQPEHQPQATNYPLESKYLNATTLVTTGTSAKGVPIATKLSSKRLNDPCSSFGGQCIILYEDSKTWDQAVASCEEKGQRLAVLKDPVAFNAYMLSNHGGQRFWLGASDKKQEGTWTWINDQSLAGFPWPTPEPNDYGGNEDCLEWGHGSNYNDERCTRALRYVCEPGCSSPWVTIGGRCYLFNTHIQEASRSWEDARNYCKGVHKADLATAGHGSASGADPLLDYIFDNDLADYKGIYLGGMRTSPGASTWIWVDGRSLSVKSYLWLYSGPSGTYGDRVSMYAEFPTVGDVHRNYIFSSEGTHPVKFVCEK